MVPRALLTALALALLLIVVPEGTGAAEYRFPNFKTLPPTDLRLETAQVNGDTHHVLRFTNTVWNAGPGKLELRGATTPEGTTLVHQRIYAGGERFREWVAGEFAYHEAHEHWHFDDFAEYELWTRAEYDAWVASGRTQGEARKRATKTTFCIIDSMKVRDLRGSPTFRAYDDCGETHLRGLGRLLPIHPTRAMARPRYAAPTRWRLRPPLHSRPRQPALRERGQARQETREPDLQRRRHVLRGKLRRHHGDRLETTL